MSTANATAVCSKYFVKINIICNTGLNLHILTEVIIAAPEIIKFVFVTYLHKFT